MSKPVASHDDLVRPPETSLHERTIEGRDAGLSDDVRMVGAYERPAVVEQRRQLTKRVGHVQMHDIGTISPERRRKWECEWNGPRTRTQLTDSNLNAARHGSLAAVPGSSAYEDIVTNIR